jgi:mRNA interferase MazF
VNWGDLYWAEVPHAGRRPVAILTRPEAIGRLPVVLVAPASTTTRGLSTEVELNVTDGAPRDCVLNLDTPELISQAMLVEHIATLSDRKMSQICQALARAVNCVRR